MIRHYSASWPITIKVPLAVAILMILVGVILSEGVLDRLQETQQRFLIDLSQSYLDGLSSAIAPSILREDNWEVFDAIERAQAVNKGLRPIETIVTNADGTVVAASNPRRHPIGSLVALDPAQQLGFDAGADTASATRVLAYPGRTAGTIYATFDTQHLAAEREDLAIALALTNGVLTTLLALAGWFMVSRMMRPVRVLSQHLGAARETDSMPIADELVADTPGEFGRLFRGYNALVKSIREREDLSKRLAEEKRLSSLGRLASTLAHEINNPLGGLFNALATLRSHGHLVTVRENSLALLERGLNGMRDVVRTTLTVYRPDSKARPIDPADINDLALLVAPEAKRRTVQIAIHNSLVKTVPLPSTPIRQALLNLLLNAVAATPAQGRVTLETACLECCLDLAVSDQGEGIPHWASDVLTGHSTSPPLIDGGGLGLWTTSRIISDLGGTIEVERPSTGGTTIRLRVPLQSKGLANVA
jgi:signal transduction histidine kinase